MAFSGKTHGPRVGLGGGRCRGRMGGLCLWRKIKGAGRSISSAHFLELNCHHFTWPTAVISASGSNAAALSGCRSRT